MGDQDGLPSGRLHRARRISVMFVGTCVKAFLPDFPELQDKIWDGRPGY